MSIDKKKTRREGSEVDRLSTRNRELQTKIAGLEQEIANLCFELLHKDRERRFWAAMFHAAKTYVAHAIKQEDMEAPCA